MASWILFDALLAGMLVLIVPIGFWRGGVKEAVVGGSILAGVSLGNAFAIRWGAAVADLLGVRDAIGETVLAEAMLWGAVVVLGYAGGATIRQTGPGLVGRIAGSIIALFNGLLLLGFSLRFINILLLGQDPDSWTEGGYVAGVLSRGTEELLLLATMVLSVGVVAGVIARLFGAWEREEELLVPEAHQATLPHAWPATPPTPRASYERHVGDVEKFEPHRRSIRTVSDLTAAAGMLQREAPVARAGQDARISHRESEPRVARGEEGPSGRFESSSSPAEDSASASLGESLDGASVVNEWLRRGARAENRRGREGNGGVRSRPDEAR